MRVGGVQHLLDPVHVAGEAGHDHAARGVAEDLLDRGGELALGGREARDLGVRGVGEEEIDPLLTQAREAAQVGDPTVERELVHLEVAGVQHHAGARADRDGEAVRDRVVDGQELEVERAVRAGSRSPSLTSRVTGRIRCSLSFSTIRASVSREAIDRDVRALAQQVRHAADVVLVPVGEHDADDVSIRSRM